MAASDALRSCSEKTAPKEVLATRGVLMTMSETSDVKANRLSSADYADNFSDIHPPLTPHEALVEADRCYFCYDAPCMTACPTSIDIPMFIRKIQAAN